MAHLAQVKNAGQQALPKGTLVKPDIGNDDCVVSTSALSDMDPCGVVHSQILPGCWGFIVVSGLCEVLVDNVGATAREDWIGTSAATAGSATASALPPPPAFIDHFREVGHTVRGRNGAGLVWAIFHPN